MSRIRTPNLCLRCRYYIQGKCAKGPENYCLITKSK